LIKQMKRVLAGAGAAATAAALGWCLYAIYGLATNFDVFGRVVLTVFCVGFAALLGGALVGYVLRHRNVRSWHVAPVEERVVSVVYGRATERVGVNGLNDDQKLRLGLLDYELTEEDRLLASKISTLRPMGFVAYARNWWRCDRMRNFRCLPGRLWRIFWVPARKKR